MKFKNVVLVAFGLSGMTGLAYEVVWSRMLQLIFGSTVYTTSAVFASFLLGFALGAYFTGRIADETDKPLLYIGRIELAIGLCGILMLLLVQYIAGIYTSLPGNQMLKLLLCTAVLIVPTTLFGALWPFVSKYYITDPEKTGTGAGSIYSINSFGSAIGAFASGIILVPLIGLRLTSLVAAAINIVLGLGLLLLSRKE